MNGKLSKKQKEDLRREHKQTRERRPADRIKAILLLDDGWIRKGQEHHIPSNTGRQRINLNGAIDPETLEVTVRCEETLNSDSTIGFFSDIETKYPSAPVIYLILDNARYYRSRKVTEYLEGSRIKPIFLPPYSPNLNLIERLWRFFKRLVLYNKFYPTFAAFKEACLTFFSTMDQRKPALRTLITENFQIIQTCNIR